VERRRALAGRLQTVGCAVNIINRSDWQRSGNFSAASVSPDLESNAVALVSGANKPEFTKAPNLICLPPRICSLRQSEQYGETLFEGEDGINAAVVSFRLVPTLTQPAKEAVLTAQITYLDLSKRLLHRVDYGFWVGEDYNYTVIGVRDTKELVLALWHSDRVLVDQHVIVVSRGPNTNLSAARHRFCTIRTGPFRLISISRVMSFRSRA
jgi:hypothetical protein